MMKKKDFSRDLRRNANEIIKIVGEEEITVAISDMTSDLKDYWAKVGNKEPLRESFFFYYFF